MSHGVRLLLLSLPLMAAACVTTEPTFLSNGMKVVRISCSLRSDSLTPCYKTAGDICGPRGYNVYDWDGEPWPRPYPEPDTQDYIGTLNPVTFLVACRPLPAGG